MSFILYKFYDEVCILISGFHKAEKIFLPARTNPHLITTAKLLKRTLLHSTEYNTAPRLQAFSLSSTLLYLSPSSTFFRHW